MCWRCWLAVLALSSCSLLGYAKTQAPASLVICGVLLCCLPICGMICAYCYAAEGQTSMCAIYDAEMQNASRTCGCFAVIMVCLFNACTHALTLRCRRCTLVSVAGVTAPQTVASIIDVVQSQAFLDAGAADSVRMVGRCCALVWCSLSVSCSAVICKVECSAVQWTHPLLDLARLLRRG